MSAGTRWGQKLTEENRPRTHILPGTSCLEYPAWNPPPLPTVLTVIYRRKSHFQCWKATSDKDGHANYGYANYCFEDRSSPDSFRGEKWGVLHEVVDGLKSPVRIQALVRWVSVFAVDPHDRLLKGIPTDFRHFLYVFVFVEGMAVHQNLGDSAGCSGNPADANRPDLLLLHAAFGPLGGRVEAVCVFVFAGVANLEAKASHAGAAESWSVGHSPVRWITSGT